MRCVSKLRGFCIILAIITLFALAGQGGMCLKAEAAAGQAAIGQCVISGGGNTVTVSISAASLPASDDGLFYLFAEPVYATGLTSDQFIATAPLGASAVFQVDLNQGKQDSRLYSQFIAAARQGGRFVPVSTGAFITNPEALADHTAARTVTASKKGLLVDPAKLTGPELTDLGVKHASYNVPVSDLLGPTTNGTYPTIHYSYNGKSYDFNGHKVAEFDNIFQILTNKGICITAILLNNFNGRNTFLMHPLARDGAAANYYAFNTAEPAGVEYIAALGAFLGERYSNTGHGKVDNWIIGNEVTARNPWNYMAYTDLNAYAAEYAKAVRLFYTAIKSRNGNANIYVSIDQQWDRNRSDPNNYDGRDLLNAFQADISSHGNIAWGVACHPYPVPLTFAPFWANSANYKSLVRHSAASPFVTMENIEVLTDFMCRPEMLSPDGQVRSIIVSEVGYTAAQGEEMQAAAFTHGYLQAAENQHIDAFILSRETDTANEIMQGLSMGLTNPDGSHKLIYDYYKNIDTPNAAVYTETARNIIGTAEWGSVLTPR